MPDNQNVLFWVTILARAKLKPSQHIVVRDQTYLVEANIRYPNETVLISRHPFSVMLFQLFQIPDDAIELFWSNCVITCLIIPNALLKTDILVLRTFLFH